VTLDFAGLPPEINSGRMYAGPGPGAMAAAAAAWDGLAAELSLAAGSYRSAVAELTGGPWAGPSSASMLAAVTPYMSWMSATAAQAEQTAGQLKSAIAAYEAAFVATVPPPVIEVNRALLAALVATNFLGQNTPAIMATEAQYAEMWAQDAAAMYGYAGASAVATKLNPFAPPPQTTDQGGTAAQASAVSQAAAAAGPSARSGLTQAMNLVPAALQGLGSGGSFDPISFVEDVLGTTTGQALNTFTTDAGNWALVISGPLFTASGITPLLGGLYGLALPQAAAVAGDVAPDAGLGAGGLDRQAVGAAVVGFRRRDPAGRQRVPVARRRAGWRRPGRGRRAGGLLRRPPADRQPGQRASGRADAGTIRAGSEGHPHDAGRAGRRRGRPHRACATGSPARRQRAERP
ncbi:PPE family protein, partial [Mycobacterium terramassiliense]